MNMPERPRHLGLKLLALTLGFLLWYFVAGESGSEFAFTVPIELRGVPDGFEIIQESAQQADVRLRGSPDILRGLTPQNISVGVDVPNVEPGEVGVYLTPSDVEVPFGVRVIRVTPTSLRLELDRTVEKTVEVVPRVVGSPAQGYELVNIDLTPNSIQLVGPSAVLNGLEQITTAPVSAEGLRDQYSRSVPLELDPLVRLRNATTVQLTLDIQEETLRREIEGVAFFHNPEPDRVNLQPETVTVVIEGPRSIVERVQAEDFEALIELAGLEAGEHAVVPLVRIKRPELLPMKILDVDPGTIRARIPGI